jgi:hypothetical protein
MRNKIRFICIIATIAASIVFSRTVSAVPSLFIDDSNPTTIHIYASDMSFAINGQSNIGSVPLSITLPDGQYYFSASWGVATPRSRTLNLRCRATQHISPAE